MLDYLFLLFQLPRMPPPRVYVMELLELPWSWNPDWLVAIGTVALAIITGFLARYTYRLFQATKEARADTLDALNLAKDQAEAMKIQAQAAEEANRIARETMHQTLRPYIVVESVEIAPAGLLPTGVIRDIDVTIRNVGQTSALAITTNIRYMIGEKNPQVNHLSKVFITPSFQGVLGTQQPRVIRHSEYFSNNDATPKNWVADPEQYPLMFIGEITYRDILSTDTRTTRFCYKRAPTAFVVHGPMNTSD